MKQIIIIAVIAIMCLVILGCATKIEFAQTGKAYPPYDGPVKILEKLPTDKQYSEIGWISAEGDWNNPWGKMITELQEKAASKGANAIVLITTKLSAKLGIQT